jgi:hypothetical protein
MCLDSSIFDTPPRAEYNFAAYCCKGVLQKKWNAIYEKNCVDLFMNALKYDKENCGHDN